MVWFIIRHCVSQGLCFLPEPGSPPSPLWLQASECQLRLQLYYTVWSVPEQNVSPRLWFTPFGAPHQIWFNPADIWQPDKMWDVCITVCDNSEETVRILIFHISICKQRPWLSPWQKILWFICCSNGSVFSLPGAECVQFREWARWRGGEVTLNHQGHEHIINEGDTSTDWCWESCQAPADTPAGPLYSCKRQCYNATMPSFRLSCLL